jgi:hypothetical protein
MKSELCLDHLGQVPFFLTEAKYIKISELQAAPAMPVSKKI